ncbi:rhomboid family intramembrane serine protease [Actinopolymorpha sp. B11F2]|uniref:rhomboid family intramembrane serine protease n=1 Tax=Actinopolymorpha sp. B11F2 TaxID=3160862 RepID=UPI0032E388AA
MTDHPRPDEPAETGGSAPQEQPACFRHPERETYIRCQRCGRHICPDCQRQAAVGFQCVECVREGARTVRAPRTRFGGVVRGEGAVATKVIIGINVAVFVAVLLFGPVLSQWLVLLGGDSFVGVNGGEVPGVSGGGYWRIVTSAFVHLEIWHLAVNMFSLWILGPMLEQLLGRELFVNLYVISAIAGGAVAYAFTPPGVPVVGASGAVFGLFGAMVVLARKLRADMSWFVGVLVINIVLNVLFRSFLSWQAHLGGFVAGMAVAAVLAYMPRRPGLRGLGLSAVLLASFALILWRTAQLTS